MTKEYTEKQLRTVYKKYNGQARLASKELGCSDSALKYKWKEIGLKPKRATTISSQNNAKNITEEQMTDVYHETGGNARQAAKLLTERFEKISYQGVLNRWAKYNLPIVRNKPEKNTVLELKNIPELGDERVDNVKQNNDCKNYPKFPPSEEDCKVGKTYFHTILNAPVIITKYDRRRGSVDIEVIRTHTKNEIRTDIQLYDRD